MMTKRSLLPMSIHQNWEPFREFSREFGQLGESFNDLLRGVPLALPWKKKIRERELKSRSNNLANLSWV